MVLSRLVLACAIAVLAVLAACGSPRPASSPPAPAATEEDRLVLDLCGKQVVLLGEATHGGGATFEARTAVARRLIAECKFQTVFIETGIYDLLHLGHGPATPAQLGAAIGKMMMATTRDAEPWLAYLAGAVTAGTIEVRGIDDQVHSTATYAQQQLAGDLAAELPGEARATCARELARHTSYQYDDATPYTPEIRDRLLGCLRALDGARGDRAVMAASLQRMLERDFGSATEMFNARDRSMFLNLQAQLAGRKAIVLCATIHAAKQLRDVPELAASVPLGAHVHEAYGDRAAAIAFTARAGGYAPIRQPVTALPAAAADSVEGTGPGLRYLDLAALRALGARSSRALGYRDRTAPWDAIVDGVVVLPEERPPQFLP